MAKEEKFKENYDRLEEIINELSKENKDIDKSIELFKEGIELYKKCEKELSVAEEEVVKILKTTGEEEIYDEQ